MWNGSQPMSDHENVVKSRNYRECEYRAQAGDPSNGDPLAVVNLKKQDKKDGGDLGEGIRFSEDARPKIAQPGNRVQNCTRGQDARIPAEYQDREPPRDPMNDGEHQENGAEQQLVGDGIEILTEKRLLLQRAGQQAIEPVAKTGEHKQN